MCGISGFCSFEQDFTERSAYYSEILETMRQVQSHRGPDDHGRYLAPHMGLSHARLSIVDLGSGAQPLLRTIGGKTWALVHNGELYNTKELRDDLISRGWSFETRTDTEVILTGFLEYGEDFVTRLNGIFAFAVWDPHRERVLLYRDRSGVKPLFYSIQPGCSGQPGYSTLPGHSGTLVFASEIKGILAFPGVKARVDRQGLNEIFSMGPARTSGCGVFQDIHEVLPGHYVTMDRDGIRQTCYWKLQSHPHEDDYETTIKHTTRLVLDAIRRQMISDVPVCTFLSGGIDSSLVSAVCAAEQKKKGERLTTFSFDFTDNDKNFKSNAFQPSRDRPFVKQMVSWLGSDHHELECTTKRQADLLKQSVDAHDLPAMADVDSSLLYFCSLVAKTHKVALTGECADEIFGGYPWFHKGSCLSARTFPWTMDLSARKVLLRDDFLDALDMDSYVAMRYEESVSETPRLASDSPEEARRREIAYLNLRWFMQTLLNRMDRTSMASGLEARVPFADHRIIEYLWNVPWDMKAKDGVVKSLLRECGREFLPEEIRLRRKSPYPKTYDSGYEKLLADKVRRLLEDSASPVLPLLDRSKLNVFLAAPSDYGRPWYGQLMAGPQMLAYIWQVDYWLRKYQVELVL